MFLLWFSNGHKKAQSTGNTVTAEFFVAGVCADRLQQVCLEGPPRQQSPIRAVTRTNKEVENKKRCRRVNGEKNMSKEKTRSGG